MSAVKEATFGFRAGGRHRILVKGLRVAALVGVFLVAALYHALRTRAGVPATFSEIWSHFLKVVLDAAPFFFLGALVSGLLETTVPADSLRRLSPNNRLGAVLSGALLGLLLPVGEVGVVLVARRLFRKGLPLYTGIAFLLAAPVVNPIAIASTYVSLGPGLVLIARVIVAMLVAITVGALFGGFAKPQEVMKSELSKDIPNGQEDEGNGAHPLRPGLLPALRVAREDCLALGGLLILGSALAALLHTVIPQENMLDPGAGPLISVLEMQALAFVQAASSTADGFQALTLIDTVRVGAIVSFLSFGAMVDIKSATMFTGVFRPKIVVYLVILPFVLNVLAGVVISAALGQ